jgi:hypothetical protein
VIHWIQIGLTIYLAGLSVTALLMAIGIIRDDERWPACFGGYDGKFLGFGLFLWPVSLPIVLYLLLWPWGPREVDLDEESIDQ